MRLDVYGQFQIDLLKVQGRWLVVRVGQGMGQPLDVTVPSELDERGAVRYLEDLWHESATPGAHITAVPR